MDAQLKKRLAIANAAFANAKESVAARGPGDFFKPDPSRYKVRISDAEVNISQGGRLQCFFELTILEGDSMGKAWRKYYGLDEKGMEFLIGDIKRLEREVPDDIERLGDLLEEIVKANLCLNVKVKENGEFINTYFDRLIKDGDEPVAPVAPAVPPAQPTPAPQAVAPAPVKAAPAPEESDDIVVGRRLSVEGKGNGTVTAIDEKQGMVTLKLESDGTGVTVTVDKLGLPIVPPPPATGLRVAKK